MFCRYMYPKYALNFIVCLCMYFYHISTILRLIPFLSKVMSKYLTYEIDQKFNSVYRFRTYRTI
jgi:hypothetical protein